MGALVGALFTRNTNKTNNKQRVNRGYDSESGTTYSENPAYGWVFAFLHPNLYQPNSLIQPLKVRSALPLSPFLSPASSV